MRVRLFTKKWKFLIFLGPHSHPLHRLRWNFAQPSGPRCQSAVPSFRWIGATSCFTGSSSLCIFFLVYISLSHCAQLIINWLIDWLIDWLRIAGLFRPFQSRTFPTEADATAVGSCVDFSCFSRCQLVDAMIPSLIAMLTWQLAARLAYALVEPRPRTLVDIQEVNAMSYFHAFPWCFRSFFI